MSLPNPPAAAPSASTTAGAQHPRGIYTLFFTEMWERLSYYGMRALLILFMTAPVASGGLGLTDKVSGAIYGLYTAGVYLAALPGGWIADRLLGAQRAVWLGGIIISLGHFTMAFPRTDTFFLGLVLIVAGTGLLKPNISALVGQLYPEGGARRDAGFTLFYMGINLGALIGPIICSALGENWNWHYGFAAAGVGMVLGLVQFALTRRHLGPIGAPPVTAPHLRRRDLAITLAGTGAIVLAVVLAWTGAWTPNPIKLAGGAATVIAGLALAYFVGLFAWGGLSPVERTRALVIAILFVASALFWAGYEQAGSSLNLFAERYTVRPTGPSGKELPAGWFQAVPALFVILFAPVVAALWVALARRKAAPSVAAKFGWGLILLAVGFVVVAFASRRALASGPVWPTWLLATYFFHVLGELLVSPVGLSSVTKLAPARFVGQMMGIWFLAASLGNLVAGLFAGEVSGANAGAMPAGFLQVAIVTTVLGVLLLAFAKPIRRLAAGAE